MNRHVIILILSLFACPRSEVYAEQFWSGDLKILSENAEMDAKEIISRDLFGHYDIVSLKVLTTEVIGNQLGRDYGLVKVTLSFSTKRNATQNQTLNPAMFEPNNCNPMKVPNWFYLHCGVPVGHVFEGNLEVLLGVSEKAGRWTAVSPNWRTLRSYPLQGYLVLEGKQKEGYVLFPK
jgi:hypothetical protein